MYLDVTVSYATESRAKTLLWLKVLPEEAVQPFSRLFLLIVFSSHLYLKSSPYRSNSTAYDTAGYCILDKCWTSRILCQMLDIVGHLTLSGRIKLFVKKPLVD